MEGWRVDNQQALKLLHRYHDATNTGRLDELDQIFAKDILRPDSSRSKVSPP